MREPGNAYTLVELMMVIAILGLVLGSIATLHATTLRAWQGSLARARLAVAIVAADERLGKDIRNAVAWDERYVSDSTHLYLLDEGGNAIAYFLTEEGTLYRRREGADGGEEEQTLLTGVTTFRLAYQQGNPSGKKRGRPPGGKEILVHLDLAVTGPAGAGAGLQTAWLMRNLR